MGTHTDHAVDDHTVTLVHFKSGAFGIIEAGFVEIGSPFIIELHGTKGTILVEDKNVRIRCVDVDNFSWQTPQLPEPAPSAMNQWVENIMRGTPTDITERDMINLTKINEAARLSAEKGRRIMLES